MSRFESNSYSEFEKAFLAVIDKLGPLKTNLLRYSNNAFMTKELRKTIMKRSQMEKKVQQKEKSQKLVFI